LPGNVIRLIWGFTVVVGTALGVAWGVYHYAVTSPRFALTEVRIDGAHRITRERLLQLGGFTLGVNVFATDLGRIQRRLLEDPWIQQARVTRQLPNALRVEINEHEAAAIAAVADRLFLTTQLGETFKELSIEDAADLPAITGVSVQGASRDAGLERQRLTSALDALGHYQKSAMARTMRAQEVHLTPAGEVVMFVGHKGVALHLGAGAWSSKFAMAERIFSRLESQRTTPSCVFLDNRAHPERVVVRLN
jgi:cell division protein FtsQ